MKAQVLVNCSYKDRQGVKCGAQLVVETNVSCGLDQCPTSWEGGFDWPTFWQKIGAAGWTKAWGENDFILCPRHEGSLGD